MMKLAKAKLAELFSFISEKNDLYVPSHRKLTFWFPRNYSKICCFLIASHYAKKFANTISLPISIRSP